MTFNQPFAARIAPLFFLAFLLLGLLISRRQRGLLKSFGRPETLRRFSRIGLPRWPKIWLAAAVALTLVAAAEPTIKNGENVTGRTVNAVVVLDVSRSMLAEDTPRGESRSDLAREALEELFAAYPEGYFGLVTFARNPRIYPMTNDHSALELLLDYNGDPRRAADEGSNLPEALEAAAKYIAKSEIPTDLVIFISDGGGPEINQMLYQRALGVLSEAGIRVVSAGVGGLKPVAIPARDASGELQGYYSRAGVLAITFRNDSALRFVAEETGGVYLVIEESSDLVEAIRTNGLATQPVLQGGDVSLVHLPLLAALVCLFLFLWSNWRENRKGQSP